MLKFILGGAGTGKSVLMSDMIKSAANSGKRVIVIVPEQFSFNSDKKLCDKLGCPLFNQILSVSFTTLSAHIFGRYGSRPGKYADDTSKLILMKRAVNTLSAEKQLLYFPGQAQKPDFPAEILELVTEFRQSGIPADEFSSAMTCDDITRSNKISDLSLIYYTYDKLLAESGLKDSLTNIYEAADSAVRHGFFQGASVFIDEFESFTGDQYKMIDSAVAQADDVCVSLRIDRLDDNISGIFDTVKNTWKNFSMISKKYNVETETVTLGKPVRYKNPDLAHLNKNILRPVREQFSGSDSIKITECADLYEEADLICSEIKRLVREENMRYSDISVMSRQLPDYTSIFETAFEKYDIPYSMDVKKSVMHTSIMQYASGVVGAAAENKFSSELIFRYAKSPLSGFSQTEVSDLENYCFEWDIDGDKWLAPFSAGLEAHPFAEETRRKIIDSLSDLKKKCSDTDCRGICTALYSFMSEMKVPERVGGIINDFRKSGLEYLAMEFRRIWDIFTEILESLAKVGGEVSLKDFCSLYMTLLRQVTYSMPPQTLDGVRISCAETARPDNPKAVFVSGVCEGAFPPPADKNGLIDDIDRLLFENAGIRLSKTSEETASYEKLIIYKTLTYASHRLFITYPLSDSSGKHRYPAAVLKQLTGMFGDIVRFASDMSVIDYSSSPKSAYINLVRYFGESTPETESIRAVLAQNGEYASRIEYLDSVSRESELKIANTDLMKKLYGERLTLSATALDEFSTCHFKYFCRTGLRLRVRKKRMVDKIGEGNLTHRCMEKILAMCPTKEDFDNLGPETIRQVIGECAGEFLENTFGTKNISSPAVNASLESISQNIEKLVKHLQYELGQSKFRPDAFELDISEGCDKPILKTQNGIEIFLNGIVDRIDVLDTGEQKFLRVIDYKTGPKNFSLGSLLYGLNMQMLLYLFAVTGENGRYKDHKCAGVLYLPSGGADCVLDRNSDDTAIQSHLNKHYKMNGVVLRDRLVLNAMEKDIKGIFIPASVTKKDKGSGELFLDKRYSSCLTSENFNKLRQYTDNVLIDMCSRLYGGDVSAVPVVSKNSAPCQYCDYKTVCGNTPLKNCRVRDENADQIMLELIGGDPNEQVD